MAQPSSGLHQQLSHQVLLKPATRSFKLLKLKQLDSTGLFADNLDERYI
jgi:hypothetical protein